MTYDLGDYAFADLQPGTFIRSVYGGDDSSMFVDDQAFPSMIQ